MTVTVSSLTFRETADGITYRLCDLPNHCHHVPADKTTCYDVGSWTWEERYRW